VKADGGVVLKVPKDEVGDCAVFEDDIGGREKCEVPKCGVAGGGNKGVILFVPFKDVCGVKFIHKGDDTDDATPVLACGGLVGDVSPNKFISKESGAPDALLR
jgi:hypothetical protein